jgi:hypothetical protein
MRRQDLALNLLLLLSLGALGWKLHRDWKDYAMRNGPLTLETRPIATVSVPSLSVTQDYTAVARQNPFQADRNDVIPEAAAQAKPMGPPPLFYGSIIMGNTRFALMGTEQSPKPERVSEGSPFDGYQLLKVLPESIILESAAGRDEIMLYNALMRLHRQQSKTTVSTASHSLTTSPVASSAPGTTPVQTSASVAEPVNSSAAATSSIAPAVAVPAGKEIVNTPFGPVTVDKKKP